MASRLVRLADHIICIIIPQMTSIYNINSVNVKVVYDGQR